MRKFFGTDGIRGLMTIATAAKQIIVDRQDICVAGGVESISKVSGSGKTFFGHASGRLL